MFPDFLFNRFHTKPKENATMGFPENFQKLVNSFLFQEVLGRGAVSLSGISTQISITFCFVWPGHELYTAQGKAIRIH